MGLFSRLKINKRKKTIGLFSRKTTEEVAEEVQSGIVSLEDTVMAPDTFALNDNPPTDGALPHNSNDAPELIALSNDEANNPTVQGEDHSDHSLQRQENETQAEYNERVPIAMQPVQPMSDTDYLGRPL